MHFRTKTVVSHIERTSKKSPQSYVAFSEYVTLCSDWEVAILSQIQIGEIGALRKL